MALQSLTSSVQRKGQVTIPLELRKDLDIQPGDEVYFRRSEEGILITTEKQERLTRFNETLDELSVAIAEKEGSDASSIEALIEEIRNNRSQILAEKYEKEPKPTQQSLG